MFIEVLEVDSFGKAKVGHQPLAARIFAKTLTAVVGVAYKIADEVVYTIRADIRHGQMSRDPKDWER
ncbi:hypothetical protein FJ930_27575 [Mesorhizobium sp. B2-4-15]|uniref:hypothetical protein n=1 Tax=Mesorhizobium sp. B2-4-15 TaxID=2589934 RepID=UPI001153FCF6|nr:hypothetical protein [Mesorhizobium sp. B2-4-15]TPK61493.1 hypothetical protein FJ930_27575 [Mesorhizobium sp. B2-4-15]